MPKKKAGPELVFVDGKVIGRLEGGIFLQKTEERHIFRQNNTKGLDVNVWQRLNGRCTTWRLDFKDTKQVLSIPFEKISQVGKITSTGAGAQYLVHLDDFNEDQVVLQEKLF